MEPLPEAAIAAASGRLCARKAEMPTIVLMLPGICSAPVRPACVRRAGRAWTAAGGDRGRSGSSHRPCLSTMPAAAAGSDPGGAR
jgi:hypothetical protein